MASPEADLRAFREARVWPGLDGLRALAVLPVVWHHATPRPLDGVLGRGPLGVDLFFALSGFLITTLLVRERDARGGVHVPRFYLRRALRLWPLYYLVLGAFVVHAWLAREAGPTREHFFASLPAHLTFTSNWLVPDAHGHPIVFAFGWSLATEEQFYAAWPWVVAARPRGLATVALAGVIALDQAAEAGLLSTGHPLADRVLRSASTPIALGALLALALARPLGFLLARRALGHRAAAPLAFVGLVAFATTGAPLPLAHLAMVALVGAVTLAGDRGPFTWSPLRSVGRVSYGIYLVHVPILAGLRPLLGDDPRTLFVVGAGASFLVARALFELIERPLAPLRARLR